MNSGLRPPTGPLRTSLPWIAALVVFAATLWFRLGWVTTYGSSMAFWDQWESEGTTLLAPWQDDQLHGADLLRSHNEHRIVLQRVWTLLAFHLNQGQWDNVVQMAGMVVLWSLFLGWLVWTWARRMPSPSIVPLAVILVAANSLPFAWENVSVALQATFLQVIALTVVALRLAARTDPSPRRIAALAAVCLAALLTVGSGLLTALAAAWTLALRTWLDGDDWRRPAVAMVLVLAVAGFGAAILVEVPGHAVLRAQDPPAFVHALKVVLAWPFAPTWGSALLLWAPWLALVACMLVLRRRMPSPWRWSDTLVAGLGAWILLQAAAIAYSRGAGMEQLGSRYGDLVALGLVVNVYGVWRLVALPHASAALRALACLVATGFTWQAVEGLRDQSVLARPWLEQRAALYRIQIDHVRAFVDSGRTEALLDHPHLHIPFPDARRLGAMLSHPTLRDMLPAVVQPRRQLCDLLTGDSQPARSQVLLMPAVADCPAQRTALLTAGLADAADLAECPDADARSAYLAFARTRDPDAAERCRDNALLNSLTAASVGRLSAWLESWKAPSRVPAL